LGIVLSGTRFRIVTEHNGEHHDKSFVMTEDEAHSLLNGEAEIYERTGWSLTRGRKSFVARKNTTVRVVSIRASTPMEDL
jgi:hypothetical protein